MGEDGPKLYTSKPKKAHQKPKKKEPIPHSSNPQSAPPAKDASPPASSSRMSNPQCVPPVKNVSPPVPPPKEPLSRRYKFLWPLLLTVNLAVGAYLFVRTRNKDSPTESDENTDETTAHIINEMHPVTETETSPIPPISESVPTSATTDVSVPVTSLPLTTSLNSTIKVHEPISDDLQRELFQWILEEKRKVKPRDALENKQIDEEKAVLKEFIRGKFIPRI